MQMHYVRWMSESTFAERLTYFRERAGLSQRELAARIGVEPSAVSAWVNDTYSPTFENLNKLVGALGIDMPTFWGRLKNSSKRRGA